VHIQALVSADGILPLISSKHQLLIINLDSVPGGQLVNSPTAQSLKRCTKPMRTIMHKFILLLFLTFTNVLTYGQEKTHETEILIIGTIHSGNQQFNHKTLYRTLKKYNPDIILWEQSEPFEREFGLLTAHRLKIVKPTIEQLALQRYSSYKKNQIILGFDTVFTSKKKYLKTFPKLKQIYYDSLFNSNKSIPDSIIFADYTKKFNDYYNLVYNETLTRINKSDIIQTSRELKKYDEEHILPLGKKYISDSIIISNFQNEVKFWIARNTYMVKQIKSYVNQYEGKRIIILTGINHKYFLTDELLEDHNINIRLNELSDN